MPCQIPAGTSICMSRIYPNSKSKQFRLNRPSLPSFSTKSKNQQEYKKITGNPWQFRQKSGISLLATNHGRITLIWFIHHFHGQTRSTYLHQWPLHQLGPSRNDGVAQLHQHSPHPSSRQRQGPNKSNNTVWIQSITGPHWNNQGLPGSHGETRTRRRRTRRRITKVGPITPASGGFN